MTKSTILEPFAATFIRLRSLVQAAAEAQWQAGRTIKPRVDTSERSAGTTSDPTSATVVDERRLQLRVAVIEAEQALEKAGKTMQAAERHLSNAIERWHNG